MKGIYIGLLFIVSAQALAADNGVRHIPIRGDEIVTVHTAVGIATIIQVDENPNTLVVGDQGAFRVEYLEHAITIKPLREGARSNLYIYTDYQRYNIRLVTGSPGLADYVVYLDPPRQRVRRKKEGPIRWYRFRKSVEFGNVCLRTTRVGVGSRATGKSLFLEFVIQGRTPTRFDPRWIWLKQKGKSRPIESLYLSSTSVSPDHPIYGVLQVLSNDVDVKWPLRVELKRNRSRRIAYFVVPRGSLWK